MAWKPGDRIPTNLIVGFLGAGKTTAISKLIDQRPEGENWSILINEFGKVSIDHALVDSQSKAQSKSGSKHVAVEELGGGCVCCTMSLVFKPLLAQFIRRTKPDRLILEPSGMSHPAKVVDILRSEGFASSIDLRNIICFVDPKDIDNPKWKESQVFQDQIQLADIVALNWTDTREREQIDRCREWIETFDPPKQLIFETSFGAIEPELLDRDFGSPRMPLFADAHPLPSELMILGGVQEEPDEPAQATPGNPIRFQNSGSGFNACGWIFHIDEVFNRRKLNAFLDELSSVVRLKGIFRCAGDWWTINRAKNVASYTESTWRRDSRLEVILSDSDFDWGEFESRLLGCRHER